MSNNVKGFVVHLETDVTPEAAQELIKALKMIKHVRNVESLESTFEDVIAYMRGRHEVAHLISDFTRNLLQNEMHHQRILEEQRNKQAPQVEGEKSQ